MELDLLSVPSYSGFILLSMHVVTVLIIGLLYLFRRAKLKSIYYYYRDINLPKYKHFLIFFYSILLSLIFVILITGSPLLGSPYNKTNIWDYSPIPQLKYLSSQISFLVLIAGIYFSDAVRCNDSRKKKHFFIIWVLVMSYLILMGHKFGQLVTFSYLFYLPLLLGKSLDGKVSIAKLVIYFSIIISVLCYLVFLYFTSKYGDYGGQLIFDRVFAMEGQLTYASIQEYISGELNADIEQAYREIKSIFGIGGQGAVGMDYLMYKYMPTSNYNYYTDLKVNLSQGYFAILFSVFGSYTLVLLSHALFTVSFFFSGWVFILSLIKRDVLIVFFSFKIFYSLYTYYVQAYTDAIFNFKNLVSLGAIVFLTMLRRAPKC